MTKTCNKCGAEKEASEFHKRNDRAGGLQPKCKQCNLEYKRSRYREDVNHKARNLVRQKYNRLGLLRLGLEFERFFGLLQDQPECDICGCSFDNKQAVPVLIDGSFLLRCRFCKDNPETKRCTKCEEAKVRSEFNKNKNYAGGITSWCRQCATDHARISRQNLNPEKREKLLQREFYERIKHKYNLVKSEYHTLLDSQGNSCAICETSFEEVRACIDHCHETDQIRGILCNWCNSLLGHARDDTYILGRAIDYLRRSKDNEYRGTSATS